MNGFWAFTCLFKDVGDIGTVINAQSLIQMKSMTRFAIHSWQHCIGTSLPQQLSWTRYWFLSWKCIAQTRAIQIITNRFLKVEMFLDLFRKSYRCLKERSGKERRWMESPLMISNSGEKLQWTLVDSLSIRKDSSIGFISAIYYGFTFNKISKCCEWDYSSHGLYEAIGVLAFVNFKQHGEKRVGRFLDVRYYKVALKTR